MLTLCSLFGFLVVLLKIASISSTLTVYFILVMDMASLLLTLLFLLLYLCIIWFLIIWLCTYLYLPTTSFLPVSDQFYSAVVKGFNRSNPTQ